MAERALIIVVDDESDALAAMVDALTRRFGADYRVVPYLSPCCALAGVCKSKEENEEIALVIADQRMPEMTGRDFLGRVRSIVPTAKRALLIEWGDREASPTILQACALGEPDNYLYKPWAPAEIHLYPFIGEFLAEWTRIHRPGMELIRVVGDDQSTRSHEIRIVEWLGPSIAHSPRVTIWKYAQPACAPPCGELQSPPKRQNSWNSGRTRSKGASA